MKLSCVLLALAISAPIPTHAAQKHRDWQLATLTETAFQREDLGAVATAMGMHGGYGPSMAMAQSVNVHRTWEGFALRAEPYTYFLALAVRGRMPNVTVHGPLKFAVEKGVYYLLDDDGREFRVILLEKSLAPTPAK